MNDPIAILAATRRASKRVYHLYHINARCIEWLATLTLLSQNGKTRHGMRTIIRANLLNNKQWWGLIRSFETLVDTGSIDKHQYGKGWNYSLNAKSTMILNTWKRILAEEIEKYS